MLLGHREQGSLIATPLRDVVGLAGLGQFERGTLARANSPIGIRALLVLSLSEENAAAL